MSTDFQNPRASARGAVKDKTQPAARWYMVDKDGMATLCTDREDAEQEAKDADMAWPHTAPHRAVQLVEASFDSADMATAAAQGFRDGVASVAAGAGSEPVAWQAQFDAWWARNRVSTHQVKNIGGFAAKVWHAAIQTVVGATDSTAGFYPADEGSNPSRQATNSSPPEGMVGGWIALPGTLPKPGTPVLLDIGKKYPIRAMWAAKHTVQAADDDTDWGEYDEATDQYWCPEGWYEWNEHEETHWAVDETPTAWCELPPNGGASHGQAPAQAAPAAVAVPTFEDFCKRHGLDPKKMDGHGGMWARVALDECRAITAQPAPQQEAQEPVAWYVTGCGRLLDEDEAKAEARHIGGTARAIPLYTAPQAQAGAVPLTEEQIKAMDRKHPAEDLCGWSYRMGIADAEQHHGIKGGQHGTE